MVKNLPANAGDPEDMDLIPGFRKILWRRKWQPTPVFLPGKSHRQKNLRGYSPGDHKESDTTYRVNKNNFSSFYTSAFLGPGIFINTVLPPLYYCFPCH